MPDLAIPAGHIHYEVHGTGYPVLLFAPGFLGSRIERCHGVREFLLAHRPVAAISKAR